MTDGLFTVDGQSITVRNIPEAIDAILAQAGTGKSFSVYTLNLDHVVKLRRDPQFRAAYASADIVTADGFPIVACGLLQGCAVERTTGSDMFVPVCAAAARAGLPIFLVGSSEETLSKAVARLKEDCPGLDVRGFRAPSRGFDAFSPEADALIGTIAESGARLCFIGLGAPKQELFAARIREKATGVGLLCTGAASDFIAGAQRRAPVAWQRLGMEWLWRLVHNPRQLFMRYARSFAVMPGLLAESLRLRLSGANRVERHP